MQIPNCPYCGQSVPAYALDSHLSCHHCPGLRVSASRCAFCWEHIVRPDLPIYDYIDKDELWCEHLVSCNAFAAFLLTGKVAYEAD